jgi:hypothetical protein
VFNQFKKIEMKLTQPYKIIISLFLISCFFLIKSNAQDLNNAKLRQGSFTANYDLDMVNNELSPISSLEPRVIGKIKFLKDINLVNNELIINYSLPQLKEAQKFIVNLKVLFDGEDISPDRHQLEGDFGEILSTKSKQKTTIWKDLISAIPKAKGQLQIQINVELWGDLRLSLGVDCNKPPEFKLKEQWPYYATAAIGVGLIVVGEIYLKKSKDDFVIHETTNSLREYEESYDDYKKNLDISRNLVYVGVGILLVDAIYFLGKRKRHKKRLRIFENNCTEQSLYIRPNVTFPTYVQSGSIGLNIRYQF